MERIGTYVNGNTIVAIYDDGTKKRYIRENETPEPEFPESIDLKITNACDLGCTICAERSCDTGRHADPNNPILDTIKPYTELAIGGGNPLEHPYLESFLNRMYQQHVICNMTVNIEHFMRDDMYEKLRRLTKQGLIHGLGISTPNHLVDGFFDKVKDFPNVVIHTIAGYTPMKVFKELEDHKLNLLILGYKIKGKGAEYIGKYFDNIVNNNNVLSDNLAEMFDHFKGIAFDNLAVHQLSLRHIVPPNYFNEMYMGDDGEFTMYIDLVEEKFGISSSHELYPIEGEHYISTLFQEVRKWKTGA